MKKGILPSPPAELDIVRDEQVPKLSERASGKISYQIGHTPDMQETFIALTGNEGGGYFSGEWVPLSKVMDKLAELSAQEPFPAVALKTVFAGKSANNASFLAAALVAEGVLAKDEEKAFKLKLKPGFQNWAKNLKTITKFIRKAGAKAEAEAAAEFERAQQDKKSQRGAKVKGQDAQQGGEHEDHPQPE